MKALIDYDILTYNCGFAVEKSFYDVSFIYQDEPFLVASFDKKSLAKEAIRSDEMDYCSVVRRVEAEPVENALQAVKFKLNDILTACGATEYCGYLTGIGNFRDEVAVTKPYKGNRDKLHKPVHYQAIRDYLVSHHGGIIVDGMEADDALAIEQWNNYKQIELIKNKGRENDPKFKNWTQTIICTIDKDLDQIPGWHYNWNKKEKYWIDEKQGLYNFYYQMLVGDSVDNIIGVYGCGPKTAEKLLKDCKTEQEMFEVVWKEYERESGTQAETIMQEMADLLYIRKHPDDRWRGLENFKSDSRNSNRA